MKTVLPTLLLCVLILSGCASTSTSTAKVTKPEKYYVGFMPLVVYTNSEFSQLDSATYEEHIRGKFNNLERSMYRNQLEKTLVRNFNRENAQTRLVKSSDLFEINTDIGYREFLQKVQATGVDGILLINQSGYWHTTDYTTVHYDNVSSTTANPQPNAAYHAYLIDVHTLKPVWYANSVVTGVYAGFDTLNNHLARALFRKLRKDKYILATY
ncbi:hypothetical protein POKO110462_08640 [Pontibacter korlensis]|uniref:Lipoprotein n=1 Tax=Pontibacter korlensis TaxID=400092 RepID=A0A0E3ZF37_9BACT|nr:hypothetical protein [Pontibacter korlensis]AKD02573.1 hypothetical protein PKOR_04840 [Pontibacter korlensis]